MPLHFTIYGIFPAFAFYSVIFVLSPSQALVTFYRKIRPARATGLASFAAAKIGYRVRK